MISIRGENFTYDKLLLVCTAHCSTFLLFNLLLACACSPVRFDTIYGHAANIQSLLDEAGQNIVIYQ